MHLEARTIAFERFKRPWMMSSGVSFARSVGIWSQPFVSNNAQKQLRPFPNKEKQAQGSC